MTDPQGRTDPPGVLRAPAEHTYAGELARLAEMATRNARDLVGTLGFFDPRISVRREQLPGARPVIVAVVLSLLQR